MATLAVFLVLGGGVTLAAISGDGSVRFGAAKGLPPLSWETVLSIPGAGKLQGFCGKGTGVRFKNTTDGTLQASAFRGTGGDLVAAELSPGESLETFVTGSDQLDFIDTVRFHVFKASAVGKPMADITVSHVYGNDSKCDRRLAAQAVTSE